MRLKDLFLTIIPFIVGYIHGALVVFEYIDYTLDEALPLHLNFILLFLIILFLVFAVVILDLYDPRKRIGGPLRK